LERCYEGHVRQQFTTIDLKGKAQAMLCENK
jgi:hypothetical protein